MDIHKPKAAHSWREFAVEIGTIICGILIALALEQAVEFGHREEEADQARAALKREMSQDIQVAQLWRREHGCWTAAIEATRRWSEGAGPRPRFAPGLMVAYQTTVWDMTRAGAVTHMPLEERLGLAEFYDQVATDGQVIGKHRDLATDVGGYLGRDRLTPAEAADLSRATDRLRWISDVEFENAGRIVALGAQMELKPGPLQRPDLDARLEGFCRQFLGTGA